MSGADAPTAPSGSHDATPSAALAGTDADVVESERSRTITRKGRRSLHVGDGELAPIDGDDAVAVHLG